MASDNTSLNSVGPIAVQLKQKLSSLEKTQINSVKNIGASLSPNAGVINGDVSSVVSGITNKEKSMMEIGVNVASKLETAGSIQKTSEKILVPAVTSTVRDRIPLSQIHKRNPIDLTIKRNRVPTEQTSVAERVKKKKNRLLGEEDFNYKGLDYPPDLQEQAEAHVELHFFNYERGSPFQAGSTNQNAIIRLPIPENFNTFHSVRFEERDTGFLGTLAKTQSFQTAVSGITDAIGSGSFEGAVNAIKGINPDNPKDDVFKVAANFAFTTLVDQEPVIGGLAGAASGMVPNPHPTVFFKGLDLREFQWTWKFVPRSAEEADALTTVLETIRQKILPPSSDGDTFLKYPNLVKPVPKPANSLWGEYKKAGVKNFSINFTGEGTSAFYQNGQPVSIIMGMTFQEVEAYTG